MGRIPVAIKVMWGCNMVLRVCAVANRHRSEMMRVMGPEMVHNRISAAIDHLRGENK